MSPTLSSLAPVSVTASLVALSTNVKLPAARPSVDVPTKNVDARIPRVRKDPESSIRFMFISLFKQLSRHPRDEQLLRSSFVQTGINCKTGPLQMASAYCQSGPLTS